MGVLLLVVFISSSICSAYVPIKPLNLLRVPDGRTMATTRLKAVARNKSTPVPNTEDGNVSDSAATKRSRSKVATSQTKKGPVAVESNTIPVHHSVVQSDVRQSDQVDVIAANSEAVMKETPLEIATVASKDEIKDMINERLRILENAKKLVNSDDKRFELLQILSDYNVKLGAQEFAAVQQVRSKKAADLAALRGNEVENYLEKVNPK